MRGRALNCGGGMAARRAAFGLAGIASVLALLVLAHPARAQVRLSYESGGNYSVYVMSWWEIPFRTVVRQQYDFSCGSAALATLLTYQYGRPTQEREAFAEMWRAGDQAAIRKVGFSMFEMKRFLQTIGYHAEGFRLKPEQLKQLNRPAIVLLEIHGYKHFAVLKGIRGDEVLLGDPVLGLSQYKMSDFEKIWNGIALAVVDAPAGVKTRFNLASDWGPWSQAPLEEGGLRTAVGDLTTHLPPIYQISSQFLVDLHGGTTP